MVRSLFAKLGLAIRLLFVWLAVIVVVMLIAEGVARVVDPLPPVAGSDAALESHSAADLPPLYTQFPAVEAAKDAVDLWHRAPYVQLARTPNIHITAYNINHDALGFRGQEIQADKPAGTYRVLVLGGSVAWGSHAVGDETTFWGVLAQKLAAAHPDKHVEVVSAGAAGWNSTQELIDLQLNGLAIHPDLVLVFDGYNDFYQPLSGGSGYMQPFGYREYDQLADYSITHPLQFWFEQRLNTLLVNSALFRGRFVQGPTAALLNVQSGDQTHWGQANAWLPGIEDRYLSNLADIVRVSTASGAKVLLVTQPSLLLDRTPIFPETDLLSGNIDQQRAAAAAFHDAVATRAPSLVDNQNSFYLDYTDVFSNFPEATYFDLVHPLSNGHAWIGQALFKDMERLHLVS